MQASYRYVQQKYDILLGVQLKMHFLVKKVAHTYSQGSLLLTWINVNTSKEYVITPLIKCQSKLLMHSQTKINRKWINNVIHNFLGMWLLIHAGFKLNHVSERGPRSSSVNTIKHCIWNSTPPYHNVATGMISRVYTDLCFISLMMPYSDINLSHRRLR